MKTQTNLFPIQTRQLVRHKLDKHKKLQKFTTWIYLKYCNVTGFSHVLPDFLIIGCPKCGTTSLYEYLIQHPYIHSAQGKEIDYFDRLHNRGLNWYKTKFPSKTSKFFSEKLFKKPYISGEATPRYLEHPHAINNIKKTIPNSKFIILLRNPIERAISHYNMNYQNGYEYLSLEQAIEKENERIQGRYEKMQQNPNYYSWDWDLFGYKNHGLYVDKIKKWFKLFPKKQFLIINSEDFLENTSTIYHNSLRFLELPLWEPDEYRLFKQRKSTKPKINPDLRNKLRKFFEPYNEELYSLLNKDFEWN